MQVKEKDQGIISKRFEYLEKVDDSGNFSRLGTTLW
jgi:hypothetical protein